MKKNIFIGVVIFLTIIIIFLAIRLVNTNKNTSTNQTATDTTQSQKSVTNDDKKPNDNKIVSTKTDSLSIEISGNSRTYKLEYPDNESQVKNIIIALHGGGETGESTQKVLRLGTLVAQNNTVIAYPDGINNSWNDIRVKNEEVDDVGFISQLIQELQKNYNLGKENTTLLGYSDGGFMAQTFVCQNNTLVGNLIAIASSLPADLAEQCTSFPLHTYFILSNKDEQVPYDGGELKTQIKGQVLSAQNTLTNIAQINKCSDRSEEKESTSVLAQKILGCNLEGDVVLLTYVNQTHLSLILTTDLVSIVKENGIVK